MIAAAARFMAAHARPMLLVGVFAGLLLPDLAGRLRPALPYLVVLLLVQSMLRIDWPILAASLRRPLIAVLSVLWLLVVSPIVAALLVRLLGLSSDLALALVLASCAPPILSGPALAALLGLDSILALVAVVAATLVVPISLPPIAALAAGVDLDLSTTTLFVRLLAVIGGALAMALTLRRIVRPARLTARLREIDGLGVAIMLLFAVAVMSGIADDLAARPSHVFTFALAAFLFNLLFQAVTALLFAPSGAVRAMTIGFIAGNRNTALLLAVLPPPIDPAIVLFVAVVQFPIYMLPSVLFPVYRRFVRGRPL